MIFADLELARRLEEVESFAGEAYLGQLAYRRPDADVAILAVAGGRALWAGPGGHLTEAKAIGLLGPVDDSDLDRLEAFYHERGEPVRVVVCPLADPSLVEGLGRRGYRVAGFENILVSPLLRDDPEASPPPGIEVHPIDPGEAEVYARVVAPNFVGPGHRSGTSWR